MCGVTLQDLCVSAVVSGTKILSADSLGAEVYGVYPTSLFSASHSCLIVFESGEFGGQVNGPGPFAWCAPVC